MILRGAWLVWMLFSTGCLMPRYLGQAAHGQAVLLGTARPIEEVIADETVDPRTRMLLATIDDIKAFARHHGLSVRGNYRHYVELPTDAAVWFVGGASPTRMKATRWCFPIVGCFAGLGWFDVDDAVRHRGQMIAQGLDAFARPAAAYSTGGWFPDPVLSAMFSDGNDALPGLVNVILHESVHATVLVPDQPFFNESFAEYVGDVMTDVWILEMYGDGSPEQLAWEAGQLASRTRGARLAAATRELEAAYAATPTPARAQLLATKAAVIDRLVADLRLTRRPNNASLIEHKVYRAGGADHARAHRACGDLASLIRAAKTLRRRDFTTPLQEDLGPITDELIRRCRATNTPR